MSQLPPEAVGTAVGVLFYSFVCEICNILTVWLVLVHEEGTSYVACISYFALISTTCSIIQQFHDYIFWEDVITAQFKNTLEQVGNPQLILANGSIGMDLVLFYIQYYCYTVEAIFVLFWAFSLTQSVYGWSAKPRWRRLFKQINDVGKIISVVLPLITICLLQVPEIQSSFAGFIIMADAEFAISCAGGCVFLIMILARYIHTRRQLKTWSLGNGNKSTTAGTATNGPQSSDGGHTARPPQGIYDRWLLVRFTIAFLFLAIFNVTNTFFQVSSQKNNNHDAVAKEPDLSAERAKETMLFNIPGVTASLLVFIVFGTTRPFRDKMYQTFVPQWLHWREATPRPVVVAPHLQYAPHDSAARQRRMSIKLSEGVDNAVQMDDLRASVMGAYLDLEGGTSSMTSLPRIPRAAAQAGRRV